MKQRQGELRAGAGKLLHRKGTDIYVPRVLLTEGVDAGEWEEVEADTLPPYTRAEYEARVAALVRERYTEAEEFALQRKAINRATTPATATIEDADAAMAEYEAYNLYVEQCKARAKDPALYLPEEPQAALGGDESQQEAALGEELTERESPEDLSACRSAEAEKSPGRSAEAEKPGAENRDEVELDDMSCHE